MLARFQEMVLRSVHQKGPDCRVGEVQDAITKIVGKEAAFGAIFTTLDRMGAKGLVKSRKGEPDNKRGGRAPRLYSITGEGIAALNEATRINYAMHQSDAGAAPVGAASELRGTGR